MKLFILMFLLFLSSGCNGQGHHIIHGSEYKYKVPEEIVRDARSFGSSIIYKGDNSKNIRLTITDFSSTIDDKDTYDEADIIVFTDKKYDYIHGLVSESTSIVNESVKKKCVEWRACYQRTFSGIQTDYYFTFDPLKDLKIISDVDFILSVYPNNEKAPADINGEIKPSCNFSLVIDELLLQVSTTGKSCDASNAKKLARYIQNAFIRWREEITEKSQ